MIGVTAVVLSARPYARRFDEINVLVHQTVVRDAAQMLDARFAAISRVKTPHFFFLDDDDDLPANYLDVLQRALALNVALAYTDELVTEADGSRRVRISGPYSPAAHLKRAGMVHHLALCRTDDAMAAVARLPRGHYYPEMLLYWELAKSGVAYLPEVGYVWNRRPGGMHDWPATTISQVRARLWAVEDRRLETA